MSWDEKAACRTSGLSPDCWYPDAKDVDARIAAKGVCFDCPVRVACGSAAVARSERFGIFAGYNIETERKQLENFLQHVEAKCIECDRHIPAGAYVFERRCWACVCGLKDPRPVTEHLARLRAAGMTWRQIAAESGLGYETVRGIPRRSNVAADTEKAMLAVQVPAVVS